MWDPYRLFINHIVLSSEVESTYLARIHVIKHDKMLILNPCSQFCSRWHV